MKVHGNAVHAVTQSRGLWPVIENMAEMTAAPAAVNFRPSHAERSVFRRCDRAFERRPEAGPARAAFEFGSRRECVLIAARAGKVAFSVFLEEWAGERVLGSSLRRTEY